MPCCKVTIKKNLCNMKCDKAGCFCIPTDGKETVYLCLTEDKIIRCDDTCRCNTKCIAMETGGAGCICVCKTDAGIKKCDDCSCTGKNTECRCVKGDKDTLKRSEEKCACVLTGACNCGDGTEKCKDYDCCCDRKGTKDDQKYDEGECLCKQCDETCLCERNDGEKCVCNENDGASCNCTSKDDTLKCGKDRVCQNSCDCQKSGNEKCTCIETDGALVCLCKGGCQKCENCCCNNDDINTIRCGNDACVCASCEGDLCKCNGKEGAKKSNDCCCATKGTEKVQKCDEVRCVCTNCEGKSCVCEISTVECKKGE